MVEITHGSSLRAINRKRALQVHKYHVTTIVLHLKIYFLIAAYAV